MRKLVDYTIARLKERSTWMGVISAGTALGFMMTTEQQDAVVAAGVAVAGLIAVVTKDKTP
jgi:hypothetical protein